MTQVEILKFIVDGTLLAAVGYLAITFGRSQLSGGQAARELRSVEESMRRLIRDADEASRELNDQLLRREQALKRTLTDVDSAEKRAREIVSNIESKDIELRSRIEVARELSRQQAPIREMAPAVSRATSVPQQVDNSEFDDAVEQPSPSRQPISTAAKHWTEIEDGDDFGLKIDKETRPSRTASNLAAAIERHKVDTKTNVEHEIKVPIGATLQDIIKAAHRMIQDGAELQAVAARTRLPLEQVRLLARAFNSRQSETGRATSSDPMLRSQSKTAADSRLGVLGSIKREVHQV